MRHLSLCILCLLLSFGLAANMLAQSSLGGSVNGTVTDPSGAALANATVRLKSAATGEVDTNDNTLNVRGFAWYNEDIGLAKEIRFKERYSFTLEGHAFNAFNRVLFGGLDSYGPGVNSDFGHMNGQENTARVLQVSGTLKFLNSVSSARMCRRVPQCWNAVAFFIFGHPPNGVSGDICCADHLVAWKWTIPQAQIASANAVEQGQPKQPPGCKRDVRLSSYAASHARATVTAIDIAAPRIRFGKNSEMRTHVTGASDIRERP